MTLIQIIEIINVCTAQQVKIESGQAKTVQASWTLAALQKYKLELVST